MRVMVWRNNEEYLGEGVLVGSVTMLEAYKHIYGVEDEEKVRELIYANTVAFFTKLSGAPLSEEQLRNFRESAGDGGTPKIELDAGFTVYGCQIWWNAAEEFKPEMAVMMGQSTELNADAIEEMRARMARPVELAV